MQIKEIHASLTLGRYLDLTGYLNPHDGKSGGIAEGGEGVISCPNPAHEDRNPSFSIYLGRDGIQRGKCFAGCFEGNSVDVLDLDRAVHGGELLDARKRLSEIIRKGGGVLPRALSVPTEATAPTNPINPDLNRDFIKFCEKSLALENPQAKTAEKYARNRLYMPEEHADWKMYKNFFTFCPDRNALDGWIQEDVGARKPFQIFAKFPCVIRWRGVNGIDMALQARDISGAQELKYLWMKGQKNTESTVPCVPKTSRKRKRSLRVRRSI